MYTTTIENIEADKITLDDIVQTQILTCKPSDSLLDASRMMSKRRCSSILVLDQDEVIGIWTEKDALKHDFSNL